MADEKEILRTALERAGFAATTIEEDADGAAATVTLAIPDVPATIFRIDAPSGWLRIVTHLEDRELDLVARAHLALAYLQTGLGSCLYEPARRRIRIAASLAAVTSAPSAEALLGTLAHLARLRHELATGEGDVIAAPAEASNLAEVARAFGRAVTLVPEKESWVGGLREPRSGTKVGMRLHTPTPGAFAFDAWPLPPAKTEVDGALVDRLDAFNTTLSAGALLLVPNESFLVFRWACPYRWLAVDQLETPAVAYTALDAFMRWAKG